MKPRPAGIGGEPCAGCDDRASVPASVRVSARPSLHGKATASPRCRQGVAVPAFASDSSLSIIFIFSAAGNAAYSALLK